MSRDLYDSLFDTDLEKVGKAQGEDAHWLALFTSAGRGWRTWFDGSLALAEFREGFYVDEDETLAQADETPVLRLAADDERTGLLVFPARYEDGTWVVVVGLDLKGEPVITLETGPGTATIRGEGVDLSLAVGASGAAPELFEPPQTLTLEDADGTIWTLTGRS